MEHEVGVVLQSFRSIERVVSEALTRGELKKMKAKAAAMDNRAVFEIPDILAAIATATQAKGSVQ
jgi:1,2-diacylglycerol 3-beta-galactosyltransferase